MTSRKFDNIQYLRALAALMVVASHAVGYADPSPDVAAHSVFLLGGVDIFFVISGFVMWTSTADRVVAPLSFYAARLIRIVPLYWAMTSVLVVVMVIWPAALHTGRFDLRHILASYAFLAWPHPTMHFMFPVLIPGWTLNYEMFFYLGFGGVLLLPVRFRVPALFAVALGLCLAHAAFSARSAALSFYTDPIILEFVAGSCIAWFAMKTPWRAGGFALVGLGLGVLLAVALPILWGTAFPRVIVNGIPAVIIVASAVLAEAAYRPRTWHAPKSLGDASYSIYLVHPLILAVLGQMWQRFGLHRPIPDMLFFVFAVLAVSAAGLLVRLCVERPLLSATRRMVSVLTQPTLRAPSRLAERIAQIAPRA